MITTLCVKKVHPPGNFAPPLRFCSGSGLSCNYPTNMLYASAFLLPVEIPKYDNFSFYILYALKIPRSLYKM